MENLYRTKYFNNNIKARINVRKMRRDIDDIEKNTLDTPSVILRFLAARSIRLGSMRSRHVPVYSPYVFLPPRVYKYSR